MENILYIIYFQVYQGQNIYFHRQQNFEKAKKKTTNNNRTGAGMFGILDKKGKYSGCMFEYHSQADFFKFFWKDIGPFLIRSFNCSISLRKGELSTSQKLGIISIIPKGNKPRELFKKMAAYIITKYFFSGIIANRLKTVLNTLIHENQKGFLAGVTTNNDPRRKST